MNVATRQKNIQIDASHISRAAEQFSISHIINTSFPDRQPSTSLNAHTKCLIKSLKNNEAAQLLPKGSYEIDVYASLIVDTRKQKAFDWVKNTNAYQRIIHLSDLEAGWDGYEAPTFSKEQIDRALTLYSSLKTYSLERGLNFSKIEPFVAPGSDGSILFEWAGKRFPVRQLEVYVPASVHSDFEYLKTKGEFEEEGEFHLDGLYPIMNWLFEFDW